MLFPLSLDGGYAKAAACLPAQRAGEAAPASGLVSLRTSDTPEGGILLYPSQIRLNRMKRGVMTAARIHQVEAEAGGVRITPWFVTLTYREGVRWEPRHVSETLKRVRQWCGRRGARCRYVWVAEVQEKRRARFGAHCLHYHLMLFLPKTLTLPMFDCQGWWPYGMTQTVPCQVRGVGYLAKYASKGHRSQIPKGVRVHGAGGLSSAGRNERTWWLCPSYVRRQFPAPELEPRRCKGGGWVSRATGEWVPSAYRIVSIAPLIIAKVRLYGNTVH